VKTLLPCLLAVMLAACGTAPKKTAAIIAPPSGGKYYQDDGPPEVVPDGLDQLPDAVPRPEAYHRYANRPYTVLGETYVPVVNQEPMKQRGLASWYGRKFHGQKTSSGETYDMFAMTAAHKTLPIPSYAKVTNLANGKSVVVRINDRGPFHSGRIIDLSYAAAKRIGILAQGSGRVEVERVFEADAGSAEASARTPEPAKTPEVAKTSSNAPPVMIPGASPPTAVMLPTPVVTQERATLWIQLGAFSSAESAESFREHVTRELTWIHEPVQVNYRDGIHRVRLGPYGSRDEADAIAGKVERSLGFAPAVSPK
jgi:rare lipoprotein A